MPSGRPLRSRRAGTARRLFDINARRDQATGIERRRAGTVRRLFGIHARCAQATGIESVEGLALCPQGKASKGRCMSIDRRVTTQPFAQRLASQARAGGPCPLYRCRAVGRAPSAGSSASRQDVIKRHGSSPRQAWPFAPRLASQARAGGQCPPYSCRAVGRARPAGSSASRQDVSPGALRHAPCLAAAAKATQLAWHGVGRP